MRHSGPVREWAAALLEVDLEDTAAGWAAISIRVYPRSDSCQVESKPYNESAMGLFHVSARLTGPTGRTATLDLLVDTCATLLVVPRALADQLELAVARAQPVQAAGGRRETWPVAEVRLALDGQEVTTPCFIAPGGSSLLGAVALESLFLAVDPVAKRLVPVEGFVD